MTEKQKIKDGNKSPTDIETMHQLLLEKGYYEEEELETIETNLQNVAQDNNVATVITATACNNCLITFF